MDSFRWREEFSVGVPRMDDTHHEFVECVDAMLQADDAGLPEALCAFTEHARSHFGQEDRDMQASAYESAGCHVDEHAAVLRSAEEVRLALEQGRHPVVREFAQALADWFPEHARVMDLGLASWLVQRRLGGSPVMIRPRASGPA
jgi:hemerythrin